LFRSDADHKFELDQIGQIGAVVLRVDCKVPWFPQVDRMVASVQERGAEPLLILGGQAPPQDDVTWRNAVIQMRDRYVPRGVRLFETPNEPNLNGWTVGTLARQALIAWEEIKKAPGTLLGVGGLAYPADSIWSWASQLIPLLGGKYDAFTWHPYNDAASTEDWSAWSVAFGNSGKWASPHNIVSVMDANGGRKPFWATECGDTINTAGVDYQTASVSHALTDTRVAMSCVYTMLDDDVPGFGLLDQNRVKRPAWDAYQRVAAG
jgi:hypothetical protein